MKHTYLLFITILIFSSCSKNKNLSRRLSGETWKVTTIEIDGSSVKELPVLTFDDCKINKENCSGTWELAGESASFIWQFRDKGETYEISNQTALNGQINAAIIQCMDYSGVYTVKDHSKTSLHIESSSTVGYTGELVSIKLEKE